MRILITGISGFIGGHLVKTAPLDHEVWGIYLDNLPASDPSRLLRVDIRNQRALEAVVGGVRPDVIIHCAAYSRVAFCEKAPSVAWEMNSRVTMGVAALCNKMNIRLIFLSSDMIFDGKKGMYSEGDKANPQNHYGSTKVAGERRVKEFVRNSVIARVNLTYGSPAYGGSSFSEEVIQTLSSGRPYHLFADQYRSFISVRNLVRCLWELVDSEIVGVVHLGGPEPMDRVTFAHKLADRLKLDKNLLIASTSKKIIPDINYPLNNSFKVDLARKLLKTPLLTVDDGLALEYPY